MHRPQGRIFVFLGACWLTVSWKVKKRDRTDRKREERNQLHTVLSTWSRGQHVSHLPVLWSDNTAIVATLKATQMDVHGQFLVNLTTPYSLFVQYNFPTIKSTRETNTPF